MASVSGFFGRSGLVLVLVSAAGAVAAPDPRGEQRNPIVTRSEAGSSAPLALLPVPQGPPEEETDHPVKRNPHPFRPSLERDPVEQPDLPTRSMPTATLNFLAQGQTNSSATITGTPPDTNGAVGPHDYVQIVNGGVQVWDKQSNVLKASVSSNALWAGYTTADGNNCAGDNDGDGVVLYDQLADRWVITQFDVPNNNGPDWQCVAVSKTSDPTGAYWLYDFNYQAFNDYGKFSVWPDGYYATFNLFNPNSDGALACAYDRVSMLQGTPATQQCFPLTQDFGILPANLDGPIPPPRGTPGFFVALDPNGTSIDVWTLHLDWTTAANSVLSSPSVLNVAAYSAACNGGTCIPQPGGAQVDSLADRLMFRLSYRNFGTHDALLVNHSVTSSNSTSGLRWYEIRSPASAPTVYQQGTYAPNDSNWRWMGSLAQDMAGDMAMGFSVSSASMNPSVAWTGRLASDAQGTMGQGETILDTGKSVESGQTRWGDYSSMTVDPSDDCTFWYTQETYVTAGAASWDTYIASVKFPNCGANDFTLPISPASGAVGPGGQTTFTVATTSSKGSPESIALSVQDLPTGVTGTFSPTTVMAGSTATLTLSAASTAVPTPATTFTIIGSAPSATHAASAQVTIALLPMVTLTSPASGATVSGSVTVSATATPANGGTLATLALGVDGTTGHSGAGSPQSYSWDTTTVSNGSHTVVATATDADGVAGQASAIVTVTNPPQVAITSPATSASVQGKVPVTVTATPPGGATVSSVTLTIDGVVAQTGGAAVLTYSWDTTSLTNGSHTLTAKAQDADGTSATATPVMVVVANGVTVQGGDGGTGAPTVGGGCGCGGGPSSSGPAFGAALLLAAAGWLSGRRVPRRTSR